VAAEHKHKEPDSAQVPHLNALGQVWFLGVCMFTVFGYMNAFGEQFACA